MTREELIQWAERYRLAEQHKIERESLCTCGHPKDTHREEMDYECYICNCNAFTYARKHA